MVHFLSAADTSLPTRQGLAMLGACLQHTTNTQCHTLTHCCSPRSGSRPLPSLTTAWLPATASSAVHPYTCGSQLPTLQQVPVPWATKGTRQAPPPHTLLTFCLQCWSTGASTETSLVPVVTATTSLPADKDGPSEEWLSGFDVAQGSDAAVKAPLGTAFLLGPAGTDHHVWRSLDLILPCPLAPNPLHVHT